MRPASASAFPSILLALVALLIPATPPATLAQTTALNIELVLEESQFLPGEEIPVGVRISNLSGRPVTFGSTPNWLTFFVETKSGEVVTRLDQVPVLGEFTLESSKAGTKWWNLQPHFGFDRPGPHLVYAELRLPDSPTAITSEPVSFTLQGASKLWEVSFGVPLPPGLTNAEPELRRYALQAATRAKERILYVRVTDEAESRILKVVSLDRYLSFANPQQQLDSQSRLHVLFQTGGSIYTYCVVNPDGDIVIRERHEIAGSRPRLSKRPDGSIAIAGGKRRPGFSDIPPYDPPVPSATNAPDATNSAPATSSVSTNTPQADPKKSSKSNRRRRRDAEPKP